ncbi:hypothetical protein DFH27DRAFT_618232 [Peziza echinospora]|nr:hypothetical protein DFH27DRAFT_618232 [Peziza echinospora]
MSNSNSKTGANSNSGAPPTPRSPYLQTITEARPSTPSRAFLAPPAASPHGTAISEGSWASRSFSSRPDVSQVTMKVYRAKRRQVLEQTADLKSRIAIYYSRSEATLKSLHQFISQQSKLTHPPFNNPELKLHFLGTCSSLKKAAEEVVMMVNDVAELWTHVDEMMQVLPPFVRTCVPSKYKEKAMTGYIVDCRRGVADLKLHITALENLSRNTFA